MRGTKYDPGQNQPLKDVCDVQNKPWDARQRIKKIINYGIL